VPLSGFFDHSADLALFIVPLPAAFIWLKKALMAFAGSELTASMVYVPPGSPVILKPASGVVGPNWPVWRWLSK